MLPTKFGGLGVRSTVDVSLPAFVASCMDSSDTVHCILANGCADAFSSDLSDAVQKWKAFDARLSEPKSKSDLQKSWDYPVAEIKLNMLIENAPDELTSGRLRAVSAPHAGAWLNAIPISSLGLKLNNESLRISVALRLGAKLSLPYNCVCGTAVGDSATHGLDCRKSIGKHARHSEVNDIIHRALSCAGTPSHLEPVGLCWDDGKRPKMEQLLYPGNRENA